jgi:hypothetical protein
MKTTFSVQAQEECQLRCLKFEDLSALEQEFPHFYIELFENALNRLKEFVSVKNKAIKQIKLVKKQEEEEI